MSRILILLLSVSLFGVAGADSAVAADDAHAEADGHGEAATVPTDPKADLALWTLVTFMVFLFVLKKLAWTPMIEGLDKREANLRQQAAETQHALDKAQSLLSDHEAKLSGAQDEVREIIAEARRDAERTGQDIVSAAQSEAEANRQRAVEDINRARDVALNELFDAMSGHVAGATEHVLGRALNDADQDRLIGDALRQVADS